MLGRSSRNTPRLHPSRHLLYAFLIGAFVTAIGFSLSRIDAARTAGRPTHTKVIVAGSETLRPFMAACAEAYMAKRGEADVIVRGGGSSTGIAAMAAGQIDVALSSRALTQAEIRNAKTAGSPLRVVPIAREAIAVIAHPNVTLDMLQIPQLAALLDGSITDWSALGVDGGHVTVIARAPGSGTASVVAAHVLGERRIAPTARHLETHEDVVAAVSATPGSIGYTDSQVASRRASAVKTLALRLEDEPGAYLPRSDLIASGKYPLTRTLFAMTVDREPHPANALIDYCAGEEAHSLMHAAGFVPLTRSAAVAQR